MCSVEEIASCSTMEEVFKVADSYYETITAIGERNRIPDDQPKTEEWRQMLRLLDEARNAWEPLDRFNIDDNNEEHIRLAKLLADWLYDIKNQIPY